MFATTTANEIERLELLYETELLDTGPEEEFDTLTRLASIICETPIALVTLVDQHRQWFKSNVGLDVKETSREVAFCAHTIQARSPFIVNDAAEDPRFSENPLVTGDPFIRFYAGVPLEPVDGLSLGSLCVIDRTPRRLTPAQLEALRMLGVQASKLISLRHRQNALRKALSAERQIERELRASEGLFHAFMDNSPFVGFMKDAEGRMVYYNQRCAERFDVTRQAWLGKKDHELWTMKMAATLRANDLSVLRQWKTLTFEETIELPNKNPVVWRSYKFPFRDSAGREYVAGLAVDISAEKLAQLELERYQEALEEANEKLRALAVTDGLTNLLNRRAFENSLESEMAMARRYSKPLSMMILDVDNFKAVNDTYGHTHGDSVLKCLAEQMKKCFRSTDVVCRYGGEEFAVLLPSTSRQAAVDIAERLRAMVMDCEPEGHSITISIGVSTFQDEPWTKAEFVRRADAALYRAKTAGKNRVCPA